MITMKCRSMIIKLMKAITWEIFVFRRIKETLESKILRKWVFCGVQGIPSI